MCAARRRRRAYESRDAAARLRAELQCSHSRDSESLRGSHWQEAPPAAAGLLRRVAVEEPLIDATTVADPVAPVVAQLIRAAVRRATAALQAELRAGEVGAVEASAQIAMLHAQLERLDDPVTGPEAENALLDWLSDREEISS